MLSLKLFALLVTTFTASVLAQVQFGDLPACVKSSILGYVGQGNCDVVDTNCICENAAIIDFIGKAVGATCDKADIASRSMIRIALFPCLMLMDASELVAFAEQLCPKLQTTTYDPIHSTTIIFRGVGGSSTTTAQSSSLTSTSGSVVSTSPTLTFSLLSSTPTTTATSSTTATPTTNTTTNGTTPSPFPGGASQQPEFGLTRLVSMVIGIVLMGMIFADL
ncbi:uncharacterized protein J3D65DRAFT_602771 [Phyllosticta citribraziliensis]|uniref:CFEM domain-containing protein n=1 Tax=Phyllosticta citribraziliensis TaxID=989973 RepID=A0ABR1LWC4_9PEZI